VCILKIAKKKCTSECMHMYELVLHYLLSFLVYWRSLAFTIWTTASCILFSVLPEERKLNEWNDMKKLNKLWQNFHFGGTCSFREIMHLKKDFFVIVFSLSSSKPAIFAVIFFCEKNTFWRIIVQFIVQYLRWPQLSMSSSENNKNKTP